MSDDSKLSTGRFARLAKLASLSAKLSKDVVKSGVARLQGVEPESLLGKGAAEKLVATLGDMKGLAMKVGQMLSMDPDLLSPEIRAVVARLQNQAPPMGYPAVEAVVTQQLGRPPKEVYAVFDETPLASASLGQVHRAVTHEGVEVAVKVQYPGIASALMADLENLGAMVNVVATGTRMTQGKEYFRELRGHLMDELDYREEGRRANLYAQAAAPMTDLVVPKVFDELTREKVLTLELLHGQTLKDFMAALDTHANAARFHASKLLIRAIVGPFWNQGVVHADPHPGNFMLLPDGRLGVLDFGSITTLSPVWLDVNRRMVDAALVGAKLDLIALSHQCGFTFDDPEGARPFVEELIGIAFRGVAAKGEFDYRTANVNKDTRALFMRNATKLGSMRPPKEAVMFFRAIGGMNQNLETLGAKGPFHSVYSELSALLPHPTT
jgi:predicted unusual protein kinase regulating ubiquinone biosynthesis (AarF/ABC1/UbiB family)